MLTVALTGGIGSGKTAVSDAFARRGVPVIDTDILARELVRLGQPALAEIVAEFGPACLDPAGALDRAWLRRVVFTEPERRRRLEAILHPRIRAAVRERQTGTRAAYCLVVIPLLIESGMTDLAQRVLVVDVPEELQVRRVMARDRVDEAHARRILAAQAGRAERLAVATEVIDNGGDTATLEKQVTDLHARYLALAASGK